MGARFGRLAAGFHSHPKAIAAGLLGRAAFFWAIDINAANYCRGRIPRGFFGPSHMSRMLDISPEDAVKALDAAVEARLLAFDEQCIVMVGWSEDEWGNSSSTQRVQAYRARKRNVDSSETVPATSETVKHIEKREKREKIERRNARALPADWQPTPAHQALAEKLQADLAFEADQFRDHAAANGRLAKDWEAAFRTWLRKANRFANGTRPPSSADALPPGVKRWT